MAERKLEPEQISALDNDTRREMIRLLKQNPDYPASLAEKMHKSKQKIHYHLKKLEESGLIKRQSEGRKNIYTVTKDSYIFNSEPVKSEFLKSLADEGLIVVGSPDQHGEDQVRARDGHLAGEIGLRLGSLGKTGYRTVLDTDVQRDNKLDKPMVILGGVLTNTVTKELNSEFPVRFTGESFPYREIETPENTYTDPEIGVIARNDDRVLVAGIRNKGTEAAVEAFKEIDEAEDYKVVRGLDLDGDGEIDDYEVLE